MPPQDLGGAEVDELSAFKPWAISASGSGRSSLRPPFRTKGKFERALFGLRWSRVWLLGSCRWLPIVGTDKGEG